MSLARDCFMIRHEQVPIKVNATVDRGIAGLVEALNHWPNVTTVSSCEGDAGHDAYVSFMVGNDWKDLGEFVDRLSASLGTKPRVCDTTRFTIGIEWYTGSKSPLGYVRVPHRSIEPLANSIRSIAQEDHVVLP
jgi:hypothetical protein